MQDNLQIASLVGNLLGGSVPKPEADKPKYSQAELDQFSNWTGNGDSKAMAKDLMKRGLAGADQLLFENVNTDSHDAIRNAQSDWKPAAIMEILSNARKYNIRTPEAVLANKDFLIKNDRWKEAINDPAFQRIHPNFWDIITKSILPEQYAKYDKKNNSDTVKK